MVLQHEVRTWWQPTGKSSKQIMHVADSVPPAATHCSTKVASGKGGAAAGRVRRADSATWLLKDSNKAVARSLASGDEKLEPRAEGRLSMRLSWYRRASTSCKLGSGSRKAGIIGL